MSKYLLHELKISPLLSSGIKISERRICDLVYSVTMIEVPKTTECFKLSL